MRNQQHIVNLDERPGTDVGRGRGYVQAPRTHALVGYQQKQASREVSTDDTRGGRYRPLALEQRLEERPAGSLQTTPARRVQAPRAHTAKGL